MLQSAKMPIGWIRATYAVYLAGQTLQSLCSLANTGGGEVAHQFFLTVAGFAVAVTGLALLFGGGQVLSDGGRRRFLAASSAAFALSCITVAVKETYRSDFGYLMYFACTVVFSLCMGWEVFVRKRGTPKMRGSVFFATLAACVNGLPDIWRGVDHGYLITRLLDAIFYLPFACYSFRLYDDMIASNDLKAPAAGGQGLTGGSEEAGENLVDKNDSSRGVPPPEIEDV
ncbi:hypothetical protein TrRE_jg12698 [Triparma retinervis]|uniref:Uncharacterized protein n=1 Tax=Triparma retinervis TaxID=2557542 RepID=A0A9W7AG58_9STRA|nr:hypothetical protein TrRE_jg12698 [Triparma retinervis]